MDILTNTFKVMVSGCTPAKLLVFSGLVFLASASICQPGKQYLNTVQAMCVNCTQCTNKLVVIRPCEIHKDTQCGTMGELLANLNPHRHRHQERHHKKPHVENNEEILWKYGEDVGGREEVPLEITSTEAPFSSAETLVWDWQAIALSSAVFACILFFLAMTLYSLHQAKQWRRLKDNFEADVEDLSARLSLMAASSAASTPTSFSPTSEKGDIVVAQREASPISDGNYLNNRCVYLEQLLNVRKDTNKIGSVNRCGGNVYIEESNGTATSPAALHHHHHHNNNGKT